MKNRRVLLDSELSPLVLDLFQEAKFEADIISPKKRILRPLLELGDYSAILVRSKVSINFEMLESAGKHLRVIGVFGDDITKIDIADASRNGILVKVTEYGNSYEVANLAARLMVKLISRSFRTRDSKKALIVQTLSELENDELTGFELANLVIGLIGCGNVAQVVATEIRPHCQRVIGYDSHLRTVYENFHQRSPLEKPVIEYNQLSEVLEHSDVISIHTAGDEKVFKGKELYFARNRPFIVNTSRSGNIDYSALLQALLENRVRGAAITLPKEQLREKKLPEWVQPFLKHNNVIIAPCAGVPASDTRRKQARRLARSLIDYLDHKDLSLAVNPMDVVVWKREPRYPLSRGKTRSTVPIFWSR
ncbi:MAG: NAD(P)-dependent oxidoreductase [Candidatus Thiodiazotropha sp.]